MFLKRLEYSCSSLIPIGFEYEKAIKKKKKDLARQETFTNARAHTVEKEKADDFKVTSIFANL